MLRTNSVPALHYFLGLLLWLLAATAYADTLVGKVVGIADGDTLVILDFKKKQHKIRLAGIDAPERKQPFGTISKESLSRLAFGKVALVEYHKRDRYGRLVAKVFVDDLDVCLEQVRLGMSWHYKEYENEQSLEDRVAYAVAEVGARRDRVGLWKDGEPVAPWKWRALQRMSR